MSGSNLFGELRRFARTSGAVGGIAARVAGERMFGIKTDRAAHAEDLKTILGGLKGPLMKVAQFLSTVPDALPAEYAAELAQLAVERTRDGVEFRPPPDGAANWAPTGSRNSPRSARRHPRPQASVRCIARACLTGRMSRASCSTPTCPAPSKPICGS